jgi:glutamate dehydrogenase
LTSITKQSYLQKILKNISFQNEGFRQFSERYLQNLSTSALKRLKPSDFKELLNEGWTFLQSWSRSSPKVSIQNLSALTTNNERGTVIQLLLNNMPFVIDSINTEIRRQGYDVNFMLRGSFNVVRKNDSLTKLLATANETANEMLVHIELRQQLNKVALEPLENDLLSIIRDIQTAVDDFTPMTYKLDTAKTDLLSASKQDEANFIEWLSNNHFIFLGVVNVNQGALSDALGILKQTDTYEDLLNELKATSSKCPSVLWLHKSSFVSKIDRQEPLDVLRIRLCNGEEICFVGILTYAAKSISFDQIPYTSNKLTKTIDRLKTLESDLRHTEILTAINHLPFIEMMNLSAEDIATLCTGILNHQSKDTALVDHRFDPILKHVSILLYLDHEKLNDSTRLRLKSILEETLDSSILHFETTYIDNDLVCVYAILTTQNDPKDIIADLPEKIALITLSWSDQLRSALQDRCGLADGEDLYKNYATIFDAAYKAKYTPDAAANDAIILESLHNHNTPINLELYDQVSIENGYQFRLKFFKESTPFALFELFTLLDSLQLKLISEASFQVSSTSREKTYWIHDLVVETSVELDFDRMSASFKELCQKILTHETSNDELNSLSIREGFTYRQIALLKGFLSYLKQIQFPFGGKYNRDILLKNTPLSATIVHLFEAKFSPLTPEDQRFRTIESLTVHFEQQLKELTGEDEDKLFRHLYNLVTYVLRTNYFVIDELTGDPKSFISFKIDSKNIIDLPLPAPMVEVFVYSKEFEATHLRCGKIARGGIRWSDRGEDYRTEVLGLVKAQNTKNAVIVPMGSKGGFYIKKPAPTINDAIECYKNMMRGLLDITDNLVDENVIHPKNVIRYDENDPYLVVAADKGTASFSDIANSISAEYSFWLKDAFASGGSAGYDHKKMAITSRGAWESVKQHFKETLNIDPETHPITAVGVGDMSGDVFGNGLLRSKTIQLKAAFNHRHIFIDPAPDAKVSFNERERLFNLPRSSWTDYSATAMSKGAMVIDRSSKIVELTPEAQAVLGLSKNIARPSEIMQAILKADVDLMWLGGIGTYIKATSETDEAVADRANDAIRINGQDVRAKIIAEGANLGCTQKGRIEYASVRNGRINTDFIDNSGGVDCSDHEVNIKILLNQIVHAGNLTLEDRNSLLKQMTSKIGAAVTSENVLQNLALSYAVHYSAEHLNEYGAVTKYLSTHAGLNSAIEFLPTSAEFNERQKLQQGLTRPELSVLLSYTKNHLKTELLKTTILDHDYFKSLLTGYFPSDLEQYTKEIETHPLRREIIATKLASEIVNRLGIHFIHRLSHQTGKSISDILAAYMVIKDFFDLSTLWTYFDTALPKLTYDDRIDVMHAISDTVYNACTWMLTYSIIPSDASALSIDLAVILKAIETANLLLSGLHECIIPTNKDIELRKHISGLQKRLTALHLSTFNTQFSPEQLTLFESTYTYLQSKFSFEVLNQMLKTIPSTDFWGQLFVLGTQLELQHLHGHLTNSICNTILTKKNTLDNIIIKHEVNIEWLSHMIQQTMMHTAYDPAAVTVIMRHLESLINTIIKDLENSR